MRIEGASVIRDGPRTETNSLDHRVPGRNSLCQFRASRHLEANLRDPPHHPPTRRELQVEVTRLVVAVNQTRLLQVED